MDDFIQSRLFDKAVPFHDTLKRLSLKTFATEINVKTIPLLIYYVKVHNVTLFLKINERSGLRNLVNHLSERV